MLPTKYQRFHQNNRSHRGTMLLRSSLYSSPPKLHLRLPHRFSFLSLTASLPFFRRRNHHHYSSCHRPLTVKAIDAAQPFDYESKLSNQFASLSKLKIAIIGFGNFGQYLSKTLVQQGHTVLAWSRKDYSVIASNLNVQFFRNPDDLFEQHPDVVLLATSIISAQDVLKSLPFQRLRRNTLFVDVLSVKEFPKKLMASVLPAHFDIICTHPMFGPQSGKAGWQGLPFVYEKVRIFNNEDDRVLRADIFVDIFRKEGCRMVQMCCEEHDLYCAGTQFLTHTVGRVLERLELESTPINTKGYESLLELMENTSGDSFELYYGLFMYNKNAMEQLEKLDKAFEELRQQLFGHLHGILRKQLFGSVGKKLQLLPENASGLAGNRGGQNNYALEKAPDTFRSEDRAPFAGYKALFSNQFEENAKLKIAIIGFGNFGQFIAKAFVRQGHRVLASSRTNYADVAKRLGVAFFSDPNDLCEEHPDVVMVCPSIMSAEEVLESLPIHRLKRNTLVVDVLSVKEFPRDLFLRGLPPDFDILCTHPMFGPQSGKNGWKGLRFVYDKVRVGIDGSRLARCNRFLDIFALEGCEMVEMSCADHDQYAAGTQFITHTMGRILEKLAPQSTPINTKGYETLLNLVENTAADSFDLYYGLFMYNKNSMEQLERLHMAFESIKKQLFERLHTVVRKQLFEDAAELESLRGESKSAKLIQNNVASSFDSRV